MDKEKIFSRIAIVVMFVYACLLNSTLVLSMSLAFTFTLIILLIMQMGDNDIMDSLFDNDQIPEDLIHKYNELLLFGSGLFIVLTSIICKLLTKN